ncbi:hypothetical protein IV203_018244 [Nitzschia inconspicua]|uniref:Uncharacterized protein n=1 Tax=Nitzschia inconspicua TaxID=303405 RepID=A0A9K3Q671_9STRA|nr:hypothetical protein IV203_018244 [Nitzschia inconspicua]
MKFYQNHGKLRGGAQYIEHVSKQNEHRITLEPGQVHEASHWMPHKGSIVISELAFVAEPISKEQQSIGIQSFVDIVVLQVPEECTSKFCDISKYGVGKIDNFQNTSFINLCENGRLLIERSVFQGFHSRLMVPSEGPMPLKVKDARIALPYKAQTYDVIFANCNHDGRRIHITGQAVLDYEESPVELSFVSIAILTIIALSICLLFSFLMIRVRRGTRAEYNTYQQVSMAAT